MDVPLEFTQDESGSASFGIRCFDGACPHSDARSRPPLHRRGIGRLRNLVILNASQVLEDALSRVVPPIDAVREMSSGRHARTSLGVVEQHLSGDTETQRPFEPALRIGASAPEFVQRVRYSKECFVRR